MHLALEIPIIAAIIVLLFDFFFFLSLFFLAKIGNLLKCRDGDLIWLDENGDLVLMMKMRILHLVNMFHRSCGLLYNLLYSEKKNEYMG